MKHCSYKKSNGQSCQRMVGGGCRRCWQHQSGGDGEVVAAPRVQRAQRVQRVQKKERPLPPPSRDLGAPRAPVSRVFPANPRAGPVAGRQAPMYPYPQQQQQYQPQMRTTQGYPMYAYQQQPVCPPGCVPAGKKGSFVKSLGKGFTSLMQNAPQLIRRGTEIAQTLKDAKGKLK